jgi:AraC-like DNA-binding protein
MTELLKGAILRYGDIHANADGLVATPIEGVTLMRAYAPTGLMHAIYKPVLCLVLGGAKQLTVGNEVRVFSAGQSVIVSADVPIIGRVVSATRTEPYLAFALDLDMGVMREVAAQLAPSAEPRSRRDAALLSDETDEALLDGALRFVRLLDRPDAVPVLRPAILREMHYWLLAGRHGAAIRQLAAVDSHAERIARAVAVLRSELARPVPVERLAATAGMSTSSFYQHFKALTSLSPRQFQKQLRLLEARRLMFSDGLSASGAAFAVGYESVSQFTREYGRMFGAPPRRDRSDGRVAA